MYSFLKLLRLKLLPKIHGAHHPEKHGIAAQRGARLRDHKFLHVETCIIIKLLAHARNCSYARIAIARNSRHTGDQQAHLKQQIHRRTWNSGHTGNTADTRGTADSGHTGNSRGTLGTAGTLSGNSRQHWK